MEKENLPSFAVFPILKHKKDSQWEHLEWAGQELCPQADTSVSDFFIL